MYDPKNFQIVIAKAAAIELLISVLALLVALFLSYLVMKYAIRDGINSSVLGKRRWTEPSDDPHVRDAVRATREAAKELPPMRED